MKRRLLIPFAMLALTLVFMASPAVTQTPSPTPSTNDANRTQNWAHFNVTGTTVPGELTVELVAPRHFTSCFEYRSDGDEAAKTSETHFNRAISDGLYPFKCLSSNDSGPGIVSLTLEADEYVEIRMVFGGETDERFPWTRVNVTPVAPAVTATQPAPTATAASTTPTPTPTADDPETKDDCKNGGWKTFGFKNQGQCNRFINTGFDSREKP